MEKVAECVQQIEPILVAIKEKQYETVEKLAEAISELEHGADLMKSDIRKHLPSSLFLSIDRSTFLEMLSLQDSIADKTEDIAVLLTITPLELLPSIEEPFGRFLAKNMQCFEEARRIIQELHELVESSFGGIEAEKVKSMCDEVAFLEHEADVIQRDLLRALFREEKVLSYAVFGLWQKIFEAIGAISNYSEKLANCVRMTLDVK
jgi:hypothetical protein